MNTSHENLYRMRAQLYSTGIDEWGDSLGTIQKLVIDTYRIMMRTSKGAWVEDCSTLRGKRFVLLTARKQFASETKEEAKSQFMFRMKRQLIILESRVNYCKQAIRSCNDEQRIRPLSELLRN